MKWYQLDEQQVLEAAKKTFPNKYVSYDTCDLYLKDLEKGTIRFAGLADDFYVSTHYVYENRLVKGNQTRYKVAIPLITVSDQRYDTIYDTANCTYCVYYEDEKAHFILYHQFLDLIQKEYEIVE